MQAGSRKGFTPVEIVILVALVGLIAVLAVPGLIRSRMLGNEASAIGSLRAIVAAESAYASSCGQNRYAAALTTLAAPAPGAAQGFLSADLAVATPRKDGYRFTLAAGAGSAAAPPDCNGRPTTTGYYAAAEPMAFNSTGARAFGVDTAGMIWQVPAAAAPAEPFGAPATPIQ